MNKKWLAFSIILAFAGTSSLLHAEGNSDEGKEKSASCVSCHGEHGNSMVSTFPKLAQQHASYLTKQLHAFKDGTRKDPMMSSLATTLSDADMEDIAAYYEQQKVSINTQPKISDDEDDDSQSPAKSEDALKAMLSQGADLYRNGDLTREVSACIACHGPLGEGNQPAAFPSLNAQHADYLIKALTDFKLGKRSNNPENMMHMIAKKMTDEEIKAVAYRISMMHNQ